MVTRADRLRQSADVYRSRIGQHSPTPIRSGWELLTRGIQDLGYGYLARGQQQKANQLQTQLDEASQRAYQQGMQSTGNLQERKRQLMNQIPSMTGTALQTAQSELDFINKQLLQQSKPRGDGLTFEQKKELLTHEYGLKGGLKTQDQDFELDKMHAAHGYALEQGDHDTANKIRVQADAQGWDLLKMDSQQANKLSQLQKQHDYALALGDAEHADALELQANEFGHTLKRDSRKRLHDTRMAQINHRNALAQGDADTANRLEIAANNQGFTLYRDDLQRVSDANKANVEFGRQVQFKDIDQQNALEKLQLEHELSLAKGEVEQAQQLERMANEQGFTLYRDGIQNEYKANLGNVEFGRKVQLQDRAAEDALDKLEKEDEIEQRTARRFTTASGDQARQLAEQQGHTLPEDWYDPNNAIRFNNITGEVELVKRDATKLTKAEQDAEFAKRPDQMVKNKGNLAAGASLIIRDVDQLADLTQQSNVLIDPNSWINRIAQATIGADLSDLSATGMDIKNVSNQLQSKLTLEMRRLMKAAGVTDSQFTEADAKMYASNIADVATGAISPDQFRKNTEAVRSKFDSIVEGSILQKKGDKLLAYGVDDPAYDLATIAKTEGAIGVFNKLDELSVQDRGTPFSSTEMPQIIEIINRVIGEQSPANEEFTTPSGYSIIVE